MRVLISWQRVKVEGYSMAPTLLPGDWLLVRHGGRVRPGAIVLGRFRSRPDLLVVKRAARAIDGGWWLASDNARLGSDSRQYGVADVLAAAIWSWPAPRGPARRRWPARLRRWLGRRPARQLPLEA